MGSWKIEGGKDNTECFYRGSERNKSSLGFLCSYDNMHGGGWLNYCSESICKIKLKSKGGE